MVERVQVLSVPYASRTASVCLDLDFPHLHREVIHHFTAIEFFQTQWFTVSHRQSTMLRSSFMIHMIWIFSESLFLYEQEALYIVKESTTLGTE